MYLQIVYSMHYVPVYHNYSRRLPVGKAEPNPVYGLSDPHEIHGEIKDKDDCIQPPPEAPLKTVDED